MDKEHFFVNQTFTEHRVFQEKSWNKYLKALQDKEKCKTYLAMSLEVSSSYW